MTQPTGEHATGVELAAGYVKVDVRTNEGMKELHADLDTLEAHSKTVGDKAGANIVTGLTAAGEPAAKGFGDKLKSSTSETERAATAHADSFRNTFFSAVKSSTAGQDWNFLFHGAGEIAEQYGGVTADKFTGRFVQLLAANRIDAGREAEKTGEEAAEGLGRGSRRALESGGEGFFSGEAFKKASEGMRGLGAQAGETGEEVGGLGEKLSGIAGPLAVFASPEVLAVGGILGVVGALGVVIDKVNELGESWEELGHTIEIQTGATGEKLEGLKDQVGEVYKGVTNSMGDVANIVGAVNTVFKDTGKGAEEVSRQLANLSAMTGKVDVDTLGTAFKGFNIGGDAEQQQSVIDGLLKTMQDTRTPVNELVNSMQRLAPTMDAAHISMKDTLAIIDEFGQAGIKPQQTFFLMNKAAADATKTGKDFHQVLTDTINQIKNAPSEAEAEKIAKGVFGASSARGGATVAVQAIRSGNLNLDPAALAQIETWDGLVNKTRADTMTWHDQWTLFTHNMSVALKPVSEELHTKVQAGLENIVAWFSAHQDTIVRFATAIVDGFEKGATAIGNLVKEALPSIKAAIDYLKPSFEEMLPHLKKLGEAFGPMAEAIGKDVVPIVKVLAEGLIWAVSKAMEFSGPALDALTRFEKVVTVVADYLNKHFVPAFKDVVQWGKDMGPVFKDLGIIFHDTFTPLFDVLKDIWDILKKVGDYVSGGLTDAFKDIGKATAGIKDLINMVPGLGHSGGGPAAHGQTGLALGGYGGGDVVPAMLEPGEHVTTKEEVRGVGGHENMYVIRQLMRHGILKEVLGLAEGGAIHPAGHEHKEHSWVMDRFNLAKPGKAFQGGGDTGSGMSWWQAIKTAFDPNPLNWFKDDPDDKVTDADVARDKSGGSHGMWADMIEALIGSKGVAPRSNSRFSEQFGMPVSHFDDGGAVGDVGLANVKALLAAESGRTPYDFGGYSPRGIDCSGLVAEAVQVYLGEDVHVGAHPMSTGNEASWLAAHGFKQGVGPEGSFRVGFYNGGPGGGHTALTLPDGTNAESGGSGGGVRLGGGAAGANSSEFTDHWYLPPRSIVEPGGYSGAGSGGSGGYGGAGGSEGGSGGGGGGGGATPEQTQALDSKVSGAQGKLDVLNQKITEAQQHLQEVEAKAPKTAKGEAGHDRAVAAAQSHLKDLEAQRDQAQGDLDSVTQERASLTGDNDPKQLVAAKDRITEANRSLTDAQAKLDRDRANPAKKPSEITEDENNVAKAKERVAKAEQHLQELESKPRREGKKGDAKDADFVGAIGDAASKGLLENLPQGFSNPTSWGGVKSAAALLKFIGSEAGKHGSPQAAAGLGLFGDILSGKGGDVGKDIAGLINPQASTYTAAGQVSGQANSLIAQVPGGGGDKTANVTNTQNITNNGVDPAKATEAATAALHRGIRSDIGLARNGVPA